MNQTPQYYPADATVQTIDRLAKPGQRSRFINQAAGHFVAHRSAEALRRQRKPSRSVSA